MPAVAEKFTTGWFASVHLGFRKSPSKTLLVERSHEGPLAVQRALYPEGDLCHVYLLHPPGGVVGGDTLNISARVINSASALITTPGATKFYRTLDPAAYQQQILTVEDGSLEWLPQENILFSGAKVELTTHVALTGDANFIGWEINCLGRPAIGERFAAGSAIFKFSLMRNNIPILHERLVVAAAKDLSGAASLRDKPVIGALYATAADTELVDSIRLQIPVEHQHEVGTTLVDGLLIARYLGDSVQTAKRLFTAIWKRSRSAILNRPACVPRIWNT